MRADVPVSAAMIDVEQPLDFNCVTAVFLQLCVVICAMFTSSKR